MKWGDFKTFVKGKLQFHGDSVVSLSDISVGSDFDTTLQTVLSSWEKDVYALRTPKAVLTLSTLDAVHDLENPATCEHPVWWPTRVWVNGAEIPRYPNVIQMEAEWDPVLTAAAEPNAWARVTDGQIQFNRVSDSAYSDSYVSGWRTHRPYVDDADQVDIPQTSVLDFARYASIHFMEGAVSDRGGLMLLKRFDEQGYLGAMRIRARNLSRVYSGSHKGEGDAYRNSVD